LIETKSFKYQVHSATNTLILSHLISSVRGFTHVCFFSDLSVLADILFPFHSAGLCQSASLLSV